MSPYHLERPLNYGPLCGSWVIMVLSYGFIGIQDLLWIIDALDVRILNQDFSLVRKVGSMTSSSNLELQA